MEVITNENGRYIKTNGSIIHINDNWDVTYMPGQNNNIYTCEGLLLLLTASLVVLVLGLFLWKLKLHTL